MQYSYKDKDNKIINKKFAGFSTYLSVNKSEEPVIDYFSMDADIIFRCDTLNCKHREKCKNSQISADKMAKKCPYIKKINKPRNDAIHSGKDVTSKEALDAITEARRIILRYSDNEIVKYINKKLLRNENKT